MIIEESIIKLITKFSKVNAQSIHSLTNVKDLNFDSLDLLEFQMAIDDEFGIEIPIDDFLNCKNVKDITNLVKNFRK
jgi:acyl carrier protein